jgi:hypothetical protein
MQFSSVTFVLAEAILWELSAKVTHHPVARDLGDDAGGSDAQADAIAVDDGRLRKWKRDDRQPIDQDMVWRFNQGFDGQAHGTLARAQNIDPIDLDGINNADSPSDFGIRDQFVIDLFAQFRRELFGIVQAAMTEFLGENDCGRDDRARQRTAAGFVNPGNARDSNGAEFFLVAKSAAPIGHRQKLSADYTDFHRNFLDSRLLSGNLRKSVHGQNRAIRELPLLPCLCECEDNLVWRDARGLVAPLPLSRSAANEGEKPARRPLRTRCGVQ